MARVVVVGGGLAGCAAAARLAKLRHDVTLVERRPVLGGAVGVLEDQGFRWDTGPATTALPAVLRDLFRKSGRPLEREVELVPLDLARRHRFRDGTVLDLPAGSRAAQLAAVDEALGPGAGRARGKSASPGRQWVDWVHAQAPVWDTLRRDWFERSAGPEHLPEATRRLLDSRATLRRAARRALDDPRLRTVAEHHAVQGGHDPRDVPAWLALLDYLEQAFGVWTVPAEAGGLGAFAALLEKRLTERRVTVLTGTTARDVVSGPAGPVAVSTDQGAVDADVVVVAVDPRTLPALAAAAPSLRRTMPAVPPTVVHLGLVGDVPELPHEVVVHDDWTLTVRTTGGAPDGAAAWTVLGRGRLAEDPVTALARAGIDVRHLVQVRHDASPRELVERWGGSPYGVLWQGRATIAHRLGTRTPLPGVHAAGAHTGGGGWVPFVGLSAALVAEAVGPA